MELDHESVLRLTPGADGTWACERMTFDTTSPNGILLSPDESTLYVAESKYGEGQNRDLRAYPVRDDGSLGAVQILHNFYPHRGIDGMCLDRDGNIVATAGWEESGPGGMIYVFTPQGRVLEDPSPALQPADQLRVRRRGTQRAVCNLVRGPPAACRNRPDGLSAVPGLIPYLHSGIATGLTQTIQGAQNLCWIPKTSPSSRTTASCTSRRSSPRKRRRSFRTNWIGSWPSGP